MSDEAIKPGLPSLSELKAKFLQSAKKSRSDESPTASRERQRQQLIRLLEHLLEEPAEREN